LIKIWKRENMYKERKRKKYERDEWVIKKREKWNYKKNHRVYHNNIEAK